MPRRTDYWFPAKRYGWGWGPPTRWQGWAVLIPWLAGELAAGVYFAPRDPATFVVVTMALAAILVWICYATGEPPRWRWGDDDASDPDA